MRSPIEMMIDKATGFNPDAKREKRPEQDPMLDEKVKASLELAEASLAWFKLHRPLKWSKAKHVKNPHVNLPEQEHRLADAVVKLIELGW